MLRSAIPKPGACNCDSVERRRPKHKIIIVYKPFKVESDRGWQRSGAFVLRLLCGSWPRHPLGCLKTLQQSTTLHHHIETTTQYYTMKNALNWAKYNIKKNAYPSRNPMNGFLEQLGCRTQIPEISCNSNASRLNLPQRDSTDRIYRLHGDSRNKKLNFRLLYHTLDTANSYIIFWNWFSVPQSIVSAVIR